MGRVLPGWGKVRPLLCAVPIMCWALGIAGPRQVAIAAIFQGVPLPPRYSYILESYPTIPPHGRDRHGLQPTTRMPVGAVSAWSDPSSTTVTITTGKT